MKVKKRFFLLFTVMLWSSSYLGGSAYYQQQQTLQGSVSFVPAGTPVSVNLAQTLSSEFSRVGETFTATLSGPIYAGNQLLAGPGSTVQGQVVNVEPAGRGGKPGSMDLRLTSVITASGQRYPLSASLSPSFRLEADGGRVSHLAKTTAVGAGAGALSGLVGSAIGGGKKGKATAIGTGIGGGIGLLGGAIKKGQELVIQSGMPLPFVLDQPIQVNTAPPPPVQQYAPQGGGFQDPYSGGGGQNPYL